MTGRQSWTRSIDHSPNSKGVLEVVVFDAFHTGILQLNISQGSHLDSGGLVDAIDMVNYKQSTNRAYELLNLSCRRTCPIILCSLM